MRLLIVLALVTPGVALADPCTGRLPNRPGQAFSGEVRYVGDGDGLCVGSTYDPKTWIEVRLADFNAPEFGGAGGPVAKQALERISLGRSVQCVAQRGRNGRVQSYDRVIAICRLNGRSVGDAMRAAGIAEGGN